MPIWLLLTTAFLSSELEWASRVFWGQEDGRKQGGVRWSLEPLSKISLGPLSNIGSRYQTESETFSAEFVPKSVTLLMFLLSFCTVLWEVPSKNQWAYFGYILKPFRIYTPSHKMRIIIFVLPHNTVNSSYQIISYLRTRTMSYLFSTGPGARKY